MDNQNTFCFAPVTDSALVLILVLMDNQNTNHKDYGRKKIWVLILVLMDNQNTTTQAVADFFCKS